MLIKKTSDIKPSEITDKALYENRRAFIKKAGIVTVASMAGLLTPSKNARAGVKLSGIRSSPYNTTEEKTPYKDITTYNNYYEFGTDKYSPAQLARTLKTRPWTVSIEGHVKKPKTFSIEEILKLAPLEERIYRMRCVEGWSMVIPWVGYSLSELIRRVEPTSNAKYIEFITLADSQMMPGLRSRVLDWPYVEGLRMDEAMHPLTLLCLGLYGEELPNQNGAPVRIVIPWKYGFKSGKSIVKIRFVETMPVSSWTKAAPYEYGFYSNVNPEVDHPRWSQATERRIGEFFKHKTIKFNGYGDQVAHLYTGMNLKQYF